MMSTNSFQSEEAFLSLHCRNVTAASISKIRFTIATLVRDRVKYAEMVNTFLSSGFGSSVEYIYVDNSKTNQFSAYEGLNHLLRSARGQYIILCHEDVKAIFDDRTILEERIEELDRIDPNWGIAGNAGALPSGSLVIRITDPWGTNRSIGPFPSRVVSLDENFLMLRRDCMLAFSSDLAGYHLYGLDLCMHALLHGHSAYVINFHLLHESKGNTNEDYQECLRSFEDKWSPLLRQQLLFTTCSTVALAKRPEKRNQLKQLHVWKTAVLCHVERITGRIYRGWGKAFRALERK